MTELGCPACGAELAKRVVAGESLLACSLCEGLLVARAVVARLRERRLQMDLELPGAGPDHPPAATPATGAERTGSTPCPSCRRTMHRYAYGGGNTRVEICDACDHLFFDRGELRAVLEEARRGITMSEEAKGLLHVHRVVATQGRLWNAELGLSLVGLAAAYFFLRVALGRGMTAVALTGGAAVAVTGYLVYRRRLVREQEDAGGRLGRLMDAEAWRLDQAKRASAAVAAKAVAKAAPAKARSCPFCAAPLSAGSTHCSACDSDFG